MGGRGKRSPEALVLGRRADPGPPPRPYPLARPTGPYS
jgi:hypothetical protein